MTGAPNTPPLLAERYRLERLLGRGAMGEVYLATDLKHARGVAIKLLAPEAIHDLSVDRFLSEIRTAAALNHPHILGVHDSGEEDGRLYYVMPRVEGESLQDLLDREGRLPVARAVDIACQVAAGLSYAHARGVIHRDIKPGNLLVDRTGHVYIADFGLALALTSVRSKRRTAAGVAVGSPLYMSPEQAGGDSSVDARTDIYALGCVLYEMLAGEPPFDAGTIREVMLLHLTAPVPSLRARRADVPLRLERAVCIALAKNPAERFETAEAFAVALSLEPTSPEPSSGSDSAIRRVPWKPVGSAAAALALTAVLLLANDVPMPIVGNPVLDTTRYVVLPFQRESGISPALRADLPLRDALAAWRGIQLASPLQVSDAVERTQASPMSAALALRLARDLGAGRYVFGTVTAVHDSARLDVGLYDANQRGREVRRATAIVAADEPVPGEVAARIANQLLFGHVDAGGTNSAWARLAYQAAHGAVVEWDLRRADSLFDAATRHDPDYARAHMWLAQVRNWAGAPAETWRASADRAAANLAAMGEDEQLLAQGLALLAAGEYPRACAVYDSLRVRDPREFAAWHGLGECHRHDDLVLEDPESPTGWRFRSSAQQAVEAYLRAFDLLPLSHRGGTFQRVLEVFYTRPNRPRVGRGSGLRFASFPVLTGDTLAFYPDSAFRRSEWGRLRRHPATIEALLHQRRIVEGLADHWVQVFPQSPDALEAQAIALDMVGDRTAAEAYHLARVQSTDEAQQLRLARGEVWARLKFGLPQDLDELTAARALADSLVAAAKSGHAAIEPQVLAALALLTGRPGTGALAARAGAGDSDFPAQIPRAVNAAADALLVFAAAGGPLDSIVALEHATELAIRNSIPEHQWNAVRQALLERSALLAFPAYTLRLLVEDHAYTVSIAAAYAAMAQGDRVGARDLLPDFSNEAPPTAGNVSFDMLYPAAWLLASLNSHDLAAEQLDAGFASLAWVQPGALEHPAHAGALVRAVALRSTIAAVIGDTDAARRWREAFSVLWSQADANLKATALSALRQSDLTGGPSADSEGVWKDSYASRAHVAGVAQPNDRRFR